LAATTPAAGGAVIPPEKIVDPAIETAHVEPIDNEEKSQEQLEGD
jgi:hypothetical protein